MTTRNGSNSTVAQRTAQQQRQQRGTAPAQQPGDNLPAGFKKVEGNKPVPTVDRKNLTAGAVLEFVKTARWPNKNEPGKEFVMHHFKGAQGIEFAAWGMAQLDARLNTVQPGAVVFVRFDGVQPHPTKAGKTLADWTVAVAEDPSAVDLTDEASIDENILASFAGEDDGDIPF